MADDVIKMVLMVLMMMMILILSIKATISGIFLGSILFSIKIHLVLVYWSVICKFVCQTPCMERFKFISAISPPHQLSMTYFGASHFHTWIRINVCIFLCIVYVNEICIKYLGLSCKLMISRYEHDTQDRLWEIFVYF